MENKRAPDDHASPGWRATPAGLVLFYDSLIVFYCNEEALRILAYPNGLPSNQRVLQGLFARKLGFDGGRNGSLYRFHCAPSIASGRRRYLSRVFSLMPHANPRSGNGTQPAIALVLERPLQPSVELSGLAQHFHLTKRECESVRLLTEGLTSKEIAARMGISANTVKVFLRLVMIKMRVSTRSGIIGKILASLTLP